MKKEYIIKRGIPFLLVGLLVLFLYLYFFVGISDIVEMIKKIDIAYYLLALVALLLSMLFYSMTWQCMLNSLSVKTAFKETFLFTWIGIFVDILVPAESISGDITRAYLMSKNSNENAGKVMASVISHRMLNLIITLAGLIVGSTIFILQYHPSEAVIKFVLVVLVGTIVSLVIFLILSLKRDITEKIANQITSLLARISKGHWQEAQLKLRAKEMLNAFHQGISILGKNWKKLGLPVIFSLVAWFFDLLVEFFVFFSIGFGISLVAVLIVYFISYAVQSIPIGIPAEIGLTEIVMSNTYMLLGVPLAIGATATILIRLLSVWFKFSIGLLAVQWVGIKALAD